MLKEGQNVRFAQNSRHGDWIKGQEGTITNILALPPQNQSSIYIVSISNEHGAIEVWATDKDIEPWDQMSLF